LIPAPRRDAAKALRVGGATRMHRGRHSTTAPQEVMSASDPDQPDAIAESGRSRSSIADSRVESAVRTVGAFSGLESGRNPAARSGTLSPKVFTSYARGRKQ
jgi:hypothetical protein